ncbi:MULTISPECIES: molecular chaperone HtpG [unclassified Nitratiruptor]|uniref:molecular chaperone HtpG n=1 Tax=unclassified Nitratiruptor TaxID=2624044 RepID=UPI0019154561|nr:MULTISPECIES: molecular chaperone HtpG [unclassified Nitratiruptor]BCD60331.1 molecular chaperone HtpG [Nitratiruptor sp. YY08-10]BCD64180.1 molecular chaperone HtpG [Nitratiruptor sp. YY08-14]
MAKHHFEAEISKLLKLMIHSLYTNKEIFLRELISNANDAIDKLHLLTLTDEKFKNFSFDPKITITLDEVENRLIVSDNGIGMDDVDMIENLGTIAKSGTKNFLEKLSGDAKKDAHLIGQFGVGFYSAFMVANRVEVVSKKAGDEKAWIWSSEANGEFEIDEAQRSEQGTDVILYLTEENKEFLQEWRIKEIVKKYSDHIPYKIYLKIGDKEEQINSAKALWRMSKSEIKEEEYKEFYKTLSHDNNDPLHWIHTKAEGTLEYTTLFYIPSVQPFDLFRADYEPGVKLYVKNVFIMQDRELLPTYLRFIRGIIDSEDLPLNISREMLQHNIVLEKIKKASVKKILSELKKLKEKERKKYVKIWELFGKVIKEGLMSDFENKELLKDLILFKTSKSDEYIDFETYVKNMKENQKSIYYLIGEKELKDSPLLDRFKKEDFEVIFFTDEVDSFIVPAIGEYNEKKLKSIASTEVDEDFETPEIDESKYKDLLEAIKEALKDEVKDVKITTRLQDSPACLVHDKNDPEFQTYELLKQMGQYATQPKPILEINPEHSIFTKLLLKNDFSMAKDIALVIYNEARLLEGMEIKDPGEFAKSLNSLIEKAL